MKRHANAASVGSNSGLGAGRGSSRPQLLISLCLALALVGALTASPALAVKTHPFTGTSFGPDGTTASSFSGISSVATDPATGDVYAYDSGAGKIYKFDSAGNPVNFSSLGTNVIEGAGGSGSGLDQIAIAPLGSPGGTAGDIYAAHYPELTVYGPDGAKLGDITGIGSACGVTTDSAGHLFVGLISPEVVREYLPSANPFNPTTDQTGTSTAELHEDCNVGVDGLGNVYSANYEGRLGVYKLEGLDAEEAINVDPKGATLAIERSNDDLYVNHGSSVSQFNSTGALINNFGTGRLSGESGGIALNDSGEKIYVGNQGSERVEVFGPLATVPTVTSEAASAITPSKATLNGTVNPDGIAVTGCEFEYGTSTEYGETAPCEGATPPDSNDHAVSAQLSGLKANTTYHFRLAATNANGTNRSEDLTFTTANYAVTGEATNIGGAKATLHGTVFPEGEAISECAFEITSPIAKTLPCQGATPPDQAEHQVTAALTHLIPNGTEYAFRLVIERGSETIEGLTKTFKTASTVITGDASAIAPPTVSIEGTINPEGIPLSQCEFQYGSTEALGSSKPCTESPATIGEGTNPVSVHANLSGLAFEATYYYRLVATNVDATVNGKTRAFNTPGAPLIESQQAGAVTDTKVELVATINPKGLATTYHLEYGTTTSYGQSTAEEEVGGDETSHVLTTTLEGLAPDTTYHWRAVAVNSHGTSEGVDRTFTTYETFSAETSCPNQALRSGASANLPGCRAYEMVSPAQKIGEVFPPSVGAATCIECLPGITSIKGPMQASPDGNAVVYQGQPFAGGFAVEPNEYLSRRTASGWTTQSLSPLLVNRGYAAFSPDLSHGLLYQADPALSPEAPSREGKGFANLYLRDEGGSLQPLVTDEPPHRAAGNLGTGAVFATVYAGANSGTAASPAFTHLIFEANDALTEEIPGVAPKAPEVEANHGCKEGGSCNLYEWTGGQLRLVNVLPGNASAATEAVIGSGYLVDGSSGYSAPTVDNAVSDDGSRIFWSEEPSGQVYVRIDGKETQKIQDSGLFLTASPDGSKVLLNDGCLYVLADEECETDLTQGQSEKIQGILGAAEDLSRIYFVDTAVLTGGEENANEEQAEAGRFNLYAWHEGATTFIGVLVDHDNRFTGIGNGVDGAGDWNAALRDRTAQVSSDGRYLAFMSYASLTGYDNNHNGGDCSKYSEVTATCPEVFEYDAASTSLTCVSCNPSGRRPLGQATLSVIEDKPFSPIGSAPFPQPSNLSAEGQGRLFFESQDVLSPRDTNGHIQDVYQWKPNGVGGCKRANGCISLISSGNSVNDSMFVDATPSGSDAFFITRQQLLLRDKDEQLDLYDARVNGGIDENTPPPCLGEACKGPASSAPEQSGPGSSTFSGPGNEKPKKAKKHKKKRKHAHKHKAKKAHKRSAKHNRGGQK